MNSILPPNSRLKSQVCGGEFVNTSIVGSKSGDFVRFSVSHFLFTMV